jgi:hypothetical protein
MSLDRPKRDTRSLEEATISNKWEIAVIVELLIQKGLCTKQDLHTIVDELRRKSPLRESLRRPFLSHRCSQRLRTRSSTTFWHR